MGAPWATFRLEEWATSGDHLHDVLGGAPRSSTPGLSLLVAHLKQGRQFWKVTAPGSQGVMAWPPLPGSPQLRGDAHTWVREPPAESWQRKAARREPRQRGRGVEPGPTLLPQGRHTWWVRVKLCSSFALVWGGGRMSGGLGGRQKPRPPLPLVDGGEGPAGVGPARGERTPRCE